MRTFTFVRDNSRMLASLSRDLSLVLMDFKVKRVHSKARVFSTTRILGRGRWDGAIQSITMLELAASLYCCAV